MKIENRKNTIKKAKENLHIQKEDIDGRLSPIKKIQELFDEGTFIETDAFISEAPNLLAGDSANLEGLVTGYGAIGGSLVFAYAQDYSRNKGAFGMGAAKKIKNLYKKALENAAPVIGIFDSDGAKLKEGTNALAAFAIALKAAADAAGKIPRISIITGNSIGANAALALESDFLISAGENSHLSLLPASVLQEKGAGEDVGSKNHNAISGLACMAVDSEPQAFVAAANILRFIPANKNARPKTMASTDKAERLISQRLSAGEYDIRALIGDLADRGEFLELYGQYGQAFVTGFAFIDGMACGILATNAAINKGKITAEAAKKASSFIGFCSTFSIPLISLVDSEGYDENSEVQNAGFAKDIASLAGAYARASMPLVTVILGKATGSVFSILGSKALGADIVFALDISQIEVMETEAAINFMWNDELAKSKDAKAIRQELKNKWEQEMSTPLNAAKNGHIDFICEEVELRARLASALNMLSMKNKLEGLL